MSRGLILFVHGLGGDAQATWGLFPQLIRDDSELRDYDVRLFSYPTSLFSLPWSKKYPRIQTLADSLRTDIENRFPTQTNIILVCHSLGGLIGRKYLLEEVKNKRPLRIQGVLLYAVPNNGAALASIGDTISWRHNQLRQLCKDADVIRDLASDWVVLKVNEAVKTKYVIAALDRVVDEQSARVFWGNPEIETVSDRGHRDVVKPRNADDTSFLILKNFVSSLAMRQQSDSGLEKYAVSSTRSTPARPAGSRFRVIGFDLDGTLLRGYEYSWTLVWKYLGVPLAVSKEARRNYLTGEKTFKDYAAWCEHDFRHMRQKGLRRQHFEEITKSVSVTNNLSEALRTLRNEGFVTAIISGGIDAFVEEMIPDAKQLFDYICINKLRYDDQGIISAIDPTPFDFAGKAAALELICRKHGATLAEAVFVGEGLNDASAANVAGLSIAYPPHGDVIPPASRVEVAEDDLLKILPHVLE
jgi:HAD superfamily phosphoserine phosphatase-like hydrolase